MSEPALRTRLTGRLGIEGPIVQAPIGSATTPELAAAVSEAGGLGTLAITWREAEEVRTLVRETKERTDAPFGVNIVVDPDAKSIPTETHVECCLDEGVEIFSFSFGEAQAVERIHDHGGTVIQTVGSAEEARKAVDAGVDIVVAQGWEAGGHVQSEVATMVLVPQVVDAVPEAPVIAAGGIADGRGIAAVLALGADGAWLGTRFLATPEARAHQQYQQRILDADEKETRYSTLFDEGWPGTPHRVLENEVVREGDAAGRPDSDRPGAGEEVARNPDGSPVYRYEDSLAVPGMEGEIEQLPLYAGQSAGATEEIRPAGELVEELLTETNEAIQRTESLLSNSN
ncbi:MAG: NAD(P)H-dependent flavin oxidoreductase [Halovenus sp.]